MATKLTDLFRHVEGKKPRFRSEPWYNSFGDSVEYFFSSAPSNAKRIDEVFTLFFARDGGELTGCKIKGVSALMAKYGDYCVAIQSKSKTKTVSLMFLFLASFTESSESIDIETQRQLKEQMIPRLGKKTVDVPKKVLAGSPS